MTILYLVGVLIAAIVALFFGTKAKEKTVNRANVPNPVESWESMVRAACQKYGVPFPVAMAVLWTESGGDPKAVGSAGEIGLFQLKEIAVKDLQATGYGAFRDWDRDPLTNIHAGVAFLDLQHSRTGNWTDAVKAYNQGYQGAKVYPERAQNYYDKVNEKMKFFSSL